MKDTKNILLAWASAGTSLLSLQDSGLMPLVTAVVLPVILFTLGKTIDVLLQIYIHRKRKEDK